MKYLKGLLACSRENGCVLLFCASMFLFLLADRLVWRTEIGQINVHGWIALLYDLLPLYLLSLAPLLLMGSCAKWLYLPFLIVESVLLVCGWFARCQFQMLLDGDVVGIVLGSSPEEMLWFFRHYASPATVLSVLLIVVFLAGLCKLTLVACRRKVTRTTVAVGLGGVLTFLYANRTLDALISHETEPFEKQLFGGFLIADSCRSWKSFGLLATMKNSPRIPSTVRLSEDQTNDVVGVVVLGESAARSHWGLYGYGRDTTPCLCARKDELVVFEDLVSPAFDTAEAMRFAFTTRTLESPFDLRFTMAQCLRRVGYGVAMFSNQKRWGEWDGDESFDFAGCDPFLFMNEQGEMNGYDEVLLPYFSDYVTNVTGKAVVFLHLQGSHVPASGRYPEAGVPFDPEVLGCPDDAFNPVLTKNHYDNSIWYTDKILGEVIRELEELHMPTWMVYFPDHGETPSSKSWRTQTDNDLWEIPFVVWTSRAFNEMYPDRVSALKKARGRALQSDQLLYGLLAFSGVEGLGNAPRDNFLDAAFHGREKRLIQNGRAEYRSR